VFVVFNHQEKWSLTLSNIWGRDYTEFLNRRRFLSNHITQTHNMSYKKDRRLRRLPDEYVNWRKWYERWEESTPGKPIQAQMSNQRGPSVELFQYQTPLQLDTQKWDAWVMMYRVTKLVFVGNLSRKSLQAKIETFKGTCLCQISSSAASKGTSC
jgi:hypothetical protein